MPSLESFVFTYILLQRSSSVTLPSSIVTSTVYITSSVVTSTMPSIYNYKN